MRRVTVVMGRAVLVLLGMAGVLMLTGAAVVDGITPGTRVVGSHTDAVLILRNDGTGAALRADNTSTGAGVLAWSKAGHGLHAMADDPSRCAVFAINTAGVGVSGRSERNDGIVGTTTAAGKSGVWGHSTAGVGVTGSSGTNDGVVGLTQATDKSGVYGYSDRGIGITAASGSGTALYVRGTSIFEKYASFEGGHGDVAENYRAGEPLEAGDVVTISDAGGLVLVRARAANDTSVAGVVASDPSLRLAGGIPDGEGVPLSIAGRVLCKVDASYGAITPGDLLTTSLTPGHAMRAAPVEIGAMRTHLPGTILGKALEPCETGTRLIQVLVTLQ